jgi:hypothetical protein
MGMSGTWKHAGAARRGRLGREVARPRLRGESSWDVEQGAPISVDEESA